MEQRVIAILGVGIALAGLLLHSQRVLTRAIRQESASGEESQSPARESQSPDMKSESSDREFARLSERVAWLEGAVAGISHHLKTTSRKDP